MGTGEDMSMLIKVLSCAKPGHYFFREKLLQIISKKHTRNRNQWPNPCTFALVGVSVGEAWLLTGLATEEAVEVGPHLVLSPGLNSVALSTPLDEELLALFWVTVWDICHG